MLTDTRELLRAALRDSISALVSDPKEQSALYELALDLELAAYNDGFVKGCAIWDGDLPLDETEEVQANDPEN